MPQLLFIGHILTSDSWCLKFCLASLWSFQLFKWRLHYIGSCCVQISGKQLKNDLSRSWTHQYAYYSIFSLISIVIHTVCKIRQCAMNSMWQILIKSLYWPCRHTGGWEVYICWFVASSLDEGEWSALCTGYSNPRNGPLGPVEYETGYSATARRQASDCWGHSLVTTNPAIPGSFEQICDFNYTQDQFTPH